MFDIGFFELMLVGIVGLLVLGPERLPKAARTAGLWVGRIKRSVANMQREITSQLEAEELRQKLAEQQKKLDDGVGRFQRDVEQSVTGKTSDTTRSAAPSTPQTAQAPPQSAPADASASPPANASRTTGASDDTPSATEPSRDTPPAEDKDAQPR